MAAPGNPARPLAFSKPTGGCDMGNLNRLMALTGLALAALALTAGPASADIVLFGTNPGVVYEDNPGTGGTNEGPVTAVSPGENIAVRETTFVTDQVTIVCEVATIGGTVTQGNTPATATLTFGWDQCRIVASTGCTVDDINGVSFDLDEFTPDFQLVTTSRAETFISCALVFNCTASSDPTDGSGLTDNPFGTGSEVTAPTTGAANPVVTIDDTLVVDGPTCPETGQWEAEYEITVPSAGLESNFD